MVERTKHRERLPVSASSAVLIEDQVGRLLLVQQNSELKGFRWGPPAGGMEAHEDPKTTAIRETREEIGVEIQLTDLVGIYTADRGYKTGVAFVFRARILKGEINPPKEEILDWRFFTLEEINNLGSQDKLYKPEYNVPSIDDWRRGISYPLGAVASLQKSNL